MSKDKTTDLPIDRVQWPEQLDARVTSPGPRPRIHGYDVQGDLARHYRFSDLIYLALTGELPAPGIDRAFEICLLFLAPVSVAEAPVHASVVANHIGAPSSHALATGCIGLAEQARHQIEDMQEMLDGLDQGKLPAVRRRASSEERDAVHRLREALAPTGFACGALDEDLDLLQAVMVVFHACGLKRRAAIEAALVAARLPCLAAEGTAAEEIRLTDYPFDLPRFRYRGRAEP